MTTPTLQEVTATVTRLVTAHPERRNPLVGDIWLGGCSYFGPEHSCLAGEAVLAHGREIAPKYEGDTIESVVPDWPSEIREFLLEVQGTADTADTASSVIQTLPITWGRVGELLGLV